MAVGDNETHCLKTLGQDPAGDLQRVGIDVIATGPQMFCDCLQIDASLFLSCAEIVIGYDIVCALPIFRMGVLGADYF